MVGFEVAICNKCPLVNPSMLISKPFSYNIIHNTYSGLLTSYWEGWYLAADMLDRSWPAPLAVFQTMYQIYVLFLPTEASSSTSIAVMFFEAHGTN